MSRCRICTANDEAELIEQMAEAMWSTQESTDTHTDYSPWAEAGPFWQGLMRGYAAASLRVLRRNFTGDG